MNEKHKKQIYRQVNTIPALIACLSLRLPLNLPIWGFAQATLKHHSFSCHLMFGSGGKEVQC